MSGETEQDVSGWTVDTVHVHLLDLIRAADIRYTQRFEAQAEAIRKAEDATEKRFESVNEFRAALTDQSRNSPSRIEVDGQYAALGAQISETRKSLEDKAASNAARISGLEGDMKGLGGRSSGVQQQWGYIFAAIGAMVAIASIIITIVLATSS